MYKYMYVSGPLFDNQSFPLSVKTNSRTVHSQVSQPTSADKVAHMSEPGFCAV